MRHCLLIVISSGILASAQSLTEAGAITAGSAAGSAAGKKVSDGITAIFQKVDKQTAKAAETKESKNSGGLLQVGPGVPADTAVVPPPPPARRPAAPSRAALQKPAPAAPLPDPAPQPVVEVVAAPQPPPPAPEVTPADLKNIEQGTSREDVLKLGVPVSRITMFDDGHMLEIFRYASGDVTFGVVRLTDGAVSKVQLR